MHPERITRSRSKRPDTSFDQPLNIRSTRSQNRSFVAPQQGPIDNSTSSDTGINHSSNSPQQQQQQQRQRRTQSRRSNNSSFSTNSGGRLTSRDRRSQYNGGTSRRGNNAHLISDGFMSHQTIQIPSVTNQTVTGLTVPSLIPQLVPPVEPYHSVPSSTVSSTGVNLHRRHHARRRGRRRRNLLDEQNRLLNTNFRNHSDTDVQLIYGPPTMSLIASPFSYMFNTSSRPSSPVLSSNYISSDFPPFEESRTFTTGNGPSEGHEIFVLGSSDEVEPSFVFNQSPPEWEIHVPDDDIIANFTDRFTPRTSRPQINVSSFIDIPTRSTVSTENLLDSNAYTDTPRITNSIPFRIFPPNTNTGDIDRENDLIIAPDNSLHPYRQGFRPRQTGSPSHEPFPETLQALIHMNGTPSYEFFDVSLINGPSFGYRSGIGEVFDMTKNRRIMDTLHATTYEESLNKYGDESCGICLEKYEPVSVIAEMYPCKHIFHKTCVLSWLKYDITCPYCRTKVIEPPIII